jgi:hypothetical protein
MPITSSREARRRYHAQQMTKGLTLLPMSCESDMGIDLGTWSTLARLPQNARTRTTPPGCHKTPAPRRSRTWSVACERSVRRVTTRRTASAAGREDEGTDPPGSISSLIGRYAGRRSCSIPRLRWSRTRHDLPCGVLGGPRAGRDHEALGGLVRDRTYDCSGTASVSGRLNDAVLGSMKPTRNQSARHDPPYPPAQGS